MAAAAVAATKAAAKEQAATTAVKAKGKTVKESQKDKDVGLSTSGTPTIAQQALYNDLPPVLDDWELSEGGLPDTHSAGQ